MTLEEIFAEWEIDSDIQEYNITMESLRTPKLHHKYYKILSSEKMRKAKMDADLAALKRIKSEYYMGTLDTETMKERGYRPFRIRVLKTDISTYLDSDQELIQTNLRIAMAKEKIEALESIIKMIMNRGFAISNAINYIKFREGQA